MQRGGTIPITNLVSDPDLKKEKGLVTFEQYLGFAVSANLKTSRPIRLQVLILVFL